MVVRGHEQHNRVRPRLVDGQMRGNGGRGAVERPSGSSTMPSSGSPAFLKAAATPKRFCSFAITYGGV